MTLPPLPKVLHGLQGPIRVRRVKRIDGDRDVMGLWVPAQRVVQVRTRLPLDVAWSVLWHEWSHAALDDTGARYHLTEQQTEAVCEAWAAAQLAAMRG